MILDQVEILNLIKLLRTAANKLEEVVLFYEQDRQCLKCDAFLILSPKFEAPLDITTFCDGRCELDVEI